MIVFLHFLEVFLNETFRYFRRFFKHISRENAKQEMISKHCLRLFFSLSSLKVTLSLCTTSFYAQSHYEHSRVFQEMSVPSAVRRSQNPGLRVLSMWRA